MTRSQTKTNKTAPKAVLYARISLDKAGQGAGVERQLTDLRKLAKSEGWKVVEEIIDNDVSAYSAAKRPGYSRLIELIATELTTRLDYCGMVPPLNNSCVFTSTVLYYDTVPR